jgi:hypothetical protein
VTKLRRLKIRKDKVMQDSKVKDAVDKARASAQELHKAISDAAAKRGGAVKADLEAVQTKARSAIDSLKGSAAAQNEEPPDTSRFTISFCRW